MKVDTIYKLIILLITAAVLYGCGDHYIFAKKQPVNEIPYNYSPPSEEGIARIMSNSYSTNWRIAKPASGDYNWGTTWNANADTIDAAIYRCYIGDILDDALSDTTINWGTSAYQVNAADLPIVDAGNYTSQTTTEAALQELMANLEADMITDTQIDFGTTAGKVSAADVPIGDAGTDYITDTVEGALAQIGENLSALGIADTQIAAVSASKISGNFTNITLTGNLSDPVDDLDVPDSMTVQKMLYAKTGRGATYFVSANDATDTEKAQADYLCDGIADQVQIQAAIDAMTSIGGHVQLSSGQFYISAPIQLVDDLRLTGCGPAGTILRLAVSADTDMFRHDRAIAETDVFCYVGNMMLNGMKASNSAGWGFYIIDDYSGYKLFDMTIQNVYIDGFSSGGIYTDWCWGWYIIDDVIEHCEGEGIEITGGTDCYITNCKIMDNYGHEIHLSNSTENVQIIGNYIAVDAYDSGVWAAGDTPTAIVLDSNNNLINGNIILVQDSADTHVNGDGIRLGTNVLRTMISNNRFSGSTGDARAGIRLLSGANYNSIIGNQIAASVFTNDNIVWHNSSGNKPYTFVMNGGADASGNIPITSEMDFTFYRGSEKVAKFDYGSGTSELAYPYVAWYAPQVNILYAVEVGADGIVAADFAYGAGMKIHSSGGAVTITANPEIATTNVSDGHMLYIIGASDMGANTVKFVDDSDSKCLLNGDMVIHAYDSLTLMCLNGRWCEVSRCNRTAD